MVVILGARRQSDILNGLDGRTDMFFCPFSIGHIGHIFIIFFINSYNIFKYAQIYSNISLSDEHEAYG
jgi:hypothetical protein